MSKDTIFDGSIPALYERLLFSLMERDDVTLDDEESDRLAKGLGHANKRDPQEPNSCKGIDQGFHGYPPFWYFSIDRPTNQNVRIKDNIPSS